MRLSIITINFNKCDGLSATLRSVQSQTFSDYEHIIVDGGSTDGSVDVIRRNESGISLWVSEPDAGIYYAMDKGVALATGEYVLFLNSGDCLKDSEVLEKVFKEDPRGVGMVYGHVLFKKGDGSWQVLVAPEQMTMYSIYKMKVCHQSTFFRRDLFSTLGPYDKTYTYAADFEYFLRCLAAGVSTKLVDVVVSIYEGGGASEVNRVLALKECDRLWARYIGVGLLEDLKRIPPLEAECRRLQRAEDWIENAKRNPLWFNLGLVIKWRWDRLVKKTPPSPRKT